MYLVIASNILSELSEQAKHHLRSFLQSLPDGALALLVEPGDRKRSQELMRYRSTLSGTGRFSDQGPCGQEIIGRECQKCSNCWNSRQHSFHQPELYLAFREVAANSMDDQRGYDQFENRLLSWSNVWVKRGAPTKISSPALQKWSGDIPVRFTKRYFQRDAEITILQPTEAGQASESTNRWKEYLQFCPAGIVEDSLVVERTPGFHTPPLKPGQPTKISGCTIVENPSNHLILQPSYTSEIVPVETSTSNIHFLSEYTDQTRSAVDEIGYRLFGFERMRDFQHRILERVMTGKSILGIAATGSGKSECFILPAMVLPGATIVVSPLVSLMMDQYDQRICERYGLEHLSTYVNGEVPFEERQARLRRLELGYYKLAYFTPEQLERSYILDSLRRANLYKGVRYLAMDEAHCISQWGHDFRPSYLNLVRRLKDYGVHPVRIALTATASPYVRKDICEELGMDPALLEQGGDVFVESSNRPELNLIARVHRNTDDKVDNIIEDLRGLFRANIDNQAPGAAIVFLPLTGGNPNNKTYENPSPRKGRLSAGVTDFASYLERQLHQKVSIYHGKMDLDQSVESEDGELMEHGDMRARNRRTEQDNFIKGKTSIMVATKGFGMGIDKDNIRLIVHRTPPANLEAYAQEAGRAGRDGQPADVILYYSPDSPEEDNGYGKKIKIRSDYDIQNFFLSEKYVQKEDVLVMRAFLKTVQNHVGKNLYFTNDEAIAFFDRCVQQPQLVGLSSYGWPTFPRREPAGYESPEHQEILNIGHLYKNKTNYIERILQVLYRIRPEFPGLGTRVPFLEQVQDTESELYQPRILNARAILNSNLYFGEKLRAAGFTEANLREFLETQDLVPLAEKLGQSMYETTSMIRDLKFAEGRFVNKSWVPALFDFKSLRVPKWGPAAGRTTLYAWREYAGAYKRAYPPEAEKRAKLAGRRQIIDRNGNRKYETALDDWFSWSELNRCRGWEVTPGAAYFADEHFHSYLQVFMQLHDQRRENDWASYRRLLGDYIGVGENGEFQHGWQRGNCLRAVLLGYLETYEVVTGDNCYGCSRCVSDGNYERYTLEQRKSAVIRMSPVLVTIFDQLKSMIDSFPSTEQESLLFDEIEREEKAGRSLRAYFSGWSGRMLDQIPGHRAALWLRFAGMARDLVPLQSKEFLAYARQLLDTKEVDYGRWLPYIEDAKEKLNDQTDYLLLLSQYYRQRNQTVDEARCLEEIFNRIKHQPTKNKTLLHQTSARLVELHQSAQQSSRSNDFNEFVAVAARTAPRCSTSQDYYLLLVADWGWDQVLEEAEQISDFTTLVDTEAALYLAWLNRSPSADSEALVTYLQSQPGKFKSWKPEIREGFYKHISENDFLDWQEGREMLLTESPDLAQVLKLGFRLLLEQKTIPQHAKLRLARILLDQPSGWKLESEFPQSQPDELCAVLDSLCVKDLFHSVETMEKWLSIYPESHEVGLETALQLVRRIQELGLAGKEATQLYLRLAGKLLENNKDHQWIMEDLERQALQDGQSLQIVLERCVKDEIFRVDLADRILDRLLEAKKIHVFAEVSPSSLPTRRWKNAKLLYDKAISIAPIVKTAVWDRDRKSALTEICEAFNWRRDVEQADMLAVILNGWILDLNPNWKTPIARLVEVLVAARRKQMAQMVVNKVGNLFINWKGTKYMASSFINLNIMHKRNEPISNDYVMIATELLFSRDLTGSKHSL